MDTFYAGATDSLPKLAGVTYCSTLSDVPNEKRFSLAWCCDVLHHISPQEETDILTQIADKSNRIIVKDIDGRHKFGNFMNRMHDRYLNGERIRDINPEHITVMLEGLGFLVEYRYLPKIWYPHFVLIAKRAENEDTAI